MSTAPNVTIIPAKIQTAENRDKYHQLKVAAYCRVSTEQEEQQNSYQVQIAYYTDLINRKKEWTLAGIFADMYNRILIQCPPHRSVEKWLKQRLSADLNYLPKAFFFVS